MAEPEPEPPFNPAVDLIAEYLRQFELAAGEMASWSRRRAVRQVRQLLQYDLLQAQASYADAQEYLDELGTPEELAEKAAAAQGGRGSSAPLAVTGIVLTTFIWPLGVPLLWYSRYWSRTEKLIATLVVPGGVPAAFYLWPALLRVAVGPVWGNVAGAIMPLATAAVAFYLVVMFVLRVDDEALGGVPRKRR